MQAAVPQTHIIEEAPDIELRGGLFYVIDRLETGQVIIRIFRPTTFFRTIAAFAERSREYRLSKSAEVIPFPVERLGAS